MSCAGDSWRAGVHRLAKATSSSIDPVLPVLCIERQDVLRLAPGRSSLGSPAQEADEAATNGEDALTIA